MSSKKKPGSSVSRKPLSLINRGGARRIAFFALCIWDSGLSSVEELSDFSWYKELIQENDEDGLLPLFPVDKRGRDSNFSQELFLGTVNNLDRVDKVIRKFLVNWDFSRLRLTDRAILRLSVYSLLYRYDIPSEVSIFEANELADDYSDDEAYKYINGILHNVKLEYRRNFITEPRVHKKKKIIKLREKK